MFHAGWCIKYEYNTADLTACILFLEGHLHAGPISWSTLQYMVSEVQYGGKITDSVDRRMFNTYAEEFLRPGVCEEGFSYTPAAPVMPIPQNYKYTVPGHTELKPFKVRDSASFSHVFRTSTSRRWRQRDARPP